MSPHVLRHYCASQLYLTGVDLISIQEMYGHAWVATTMATFTSTAAGSRTPGSPASSAPPPGWKD